MESAADSPQLCCPRMRCRKAVLGPPPLQQCPSCRGFWIPESVLVERVETMQGSPPQLDWQPEVRAVVMCVACGESMETLSLYSVPIDRCRGHGVWFDGGELEQVLERGKHPPRASPRYDDGGSGGEVSALAVDAAIVAAEVPEIVVVGVAAEAGVGVLDVVGGVAGAAVDVVGAIAEGLLDGLTSILDF